MTSVITISLKPATDLTPAEITDCYALVARTGNHYPPGSLEQFHLAYNPTMVLAHQENQLVGFQSYSLYEERMPFRRKKMPLIYAGTAYVYARATGHGITPRMAFYYLRHVLGRFWALRNYAALMGTHNPRIIQLVGIQHKLYLPATNAMNPAIHEFVLNFAREKRSICDPICDQLVVHPPDTTSVRTDITTQWPLQYRASEEPFNKLAYDLKLLEEVEGRHYQTGRFVLVLFRSSRSQLLKAAWTRCRRQIRKQFKLASRA